MKNLQRIKNMSTPALIGCAGAAALALAALIFFAVAAATAYRPAPRETLYNRLQPALCLADTLTITTWNVGYCGLSAEADFFYDGGKMVRESEPRVRENLRHVADFLQHNGSDFTLLQELDRHSKRSYYMDELDTIVAQQENVHPFFATNFKTLYVPIPLRGAIGRVHAGVATLSRCKPYLVVRHAYPFAKPFPVSLFELRRCFLACRYTAPNGRDLVLVNTHNSAYDNGSQRQREMQLLRDFAMQEFDDGNYVIVGGDWNQTPPDYDKQVGTKEYTPFRLDSTLFAQGWHWVYDRSCETMRFTNEPYREGKTLSSTVDFFIASPHVQALSVTVHDLSFAHSDHNPVTAKFELQK
jgi:endonuclease/exonuclease/phosphatase family metal-dependent hydrolase